MCESVEEMGTPAGTTEGNQHYGKGKMQDGIESALRWWLQMDKPVNQETPKIGPRKWAAEDDRYEGRRLNICCLYDGLKFRLTFPGEFYLNVRITSRRLLDIIIIFILIILEKAGI